MGPIGIGVFAPSDPLTPRRLAAVMAQAERLRSLGFAVTLGDSIRLGEDVYDTPSPQERAREIELLAAEESVDVMLGAWGGKTCNEILSLLDFELLNANGKPILGFSDVAVLANAQYLNGHVPSIFGPNVLGKLHESKFSDLEFLARGLRKGEDPFHTTLSENPRWAGSGSVTGRLLGGNLCTFVLSIATWRAIDFPADVVLFLETTASATNVVREYLAALELSTLMKHTRALIFGALSFTESTEDVSAFIHHVNDKFGIPVVHVPTFGHGEYPNPPIPIGTACMIDMDNHSIGLVEPWGITEHGSSRRS